jgi:lysophospholipase L1-like esterase
MHLNPLTIKIISFVLIICVVLAITLPLIFIKRDAQPEPAILYHNKEKLSEYITSFKTEQARIFAIGDSTTMGVGPNSTDFSAGSWIGNLVLSKSFSRESFIGFAYNQFDYSSIVDNRLSIDRGWACDNGGLQGSFSLGGGLYTTQSQTAQITFTPSKPIEILEIYIANKSSPIQIVTDGITTICDPQSSSNPGDGAIVKFVITKSVSNRVPVIFSSPTASSSKPAYLSGMIAYNSDDKYILVNVGVGGATSLSVLDVATNDYSIKNILSIYNPSLLVVNLCINEYLLSPNGTPPFIGESLEDYKITYNKLLQLLKENGTVIGYTPVINPTSDLALQTSYVDAARELFARNNITWFNLFAYCRTVDNEVNNGWLISSDTHPLPEGYKMIGKMLSELINVA